MYVFWALGGRLKSLRFSAMFAVALITTDAALASPIDFSFSYSGLNVSATGELITDGTLTDGFYTVTGISGERNGVTISELAAPGGFGLNDNLLSATTLSFDSNGLTYLIGDVSYNLYLSGTCDPGQVAESTGSFSCSQVTPVHLSVSSSLPVDEPWSLPSLTFGAFVLLLLRRRSVTVGQVRMVHQPYAVLCKE